MRWQCLRALPTLFFVVAGADCRPNAQVLPLLPLLREPLPVIHHNTPCCAKWGELPD